jgi:neutral ceramidase
MTLQVGTAAADITPPVGCRMGGYGSRTGKAERVAAPLRCHAVVFDDGTSPVGLVVCDLLFVTWDITSRARRLVAEALGWPEGALMVTATHTHSGPAGLTAGQDESYVDVVARQIAGSVIEAFAARRTAVVKYAQTSVSSISQNRRDVNGPIETVARLLIAESAEPAATLATIVSYACHATVLEADNLAVSPDFPGATVDVIEALSGGRATYLQGCAGAINPVWMRHDHDEARRIGTILGAAAARVVAEALPAGRGQWAVNLSWAQDTPKEPEGAQVVAAGPLSHRSVKVKLHRRERPALPEVDAELASIGATLAQEGIATGERHALLARRATLGMEHYFSQHPYVYAGRGGGPEANDEDEVEVQAIRIGRSAAIVGIPGEPFLAIADEIRRRSGLAHVLVAGYANEAIGYVPVADEFPAHGYEVGCARFTPEAADAVVNGALTALADG